jgi:hypothetical protein
MTGSVLVVDWYCDGATSGLQDRTVYPREVV